MKLFDYQYYRSRIPELDYLRGMAILMVLLSHYPAIEPLTHLWVGVDLFFVLSGYLVAGLLIRDTERNGRLRFKRFFIRRGLKIYPSFYVFLASTLLITAVLRATGYPVFSIQLTLPRILTEVFYIQNFRDAVWLHTWSLGVEEQFYIALPLLLMILMRSANWIRLLFGTMAVFIVGITVLRFLECDLGTVEYKHTHLIDFYFRLDALFLGVVAACSERLFLKRLMRIPNAFWVILSALGVAVVAAFAFSLHALPCHWARAGYTLVNLSFFVWVMSIVLLRKKEFRGLAFLKPFVLFKPVASIGLYSYNIYLWHAFMIDVLFALVYLTTKANILFPYAWRYLIPYLIMSVLMGFVMTKYVEVPILKWREKKFQ